MIFLISFSEMRNALPQQAGRRTTHIGWWASGNAAQPTNPLLKNLLLPLTFGGGNAKLPASFPIGRAMP